MACKSITVIVTIGVGVGLGLTSVPPFGLVLSLPGKVLSLVLDKIADPGRGKAADAF